MKNSFDTISNKQAIELLKMVNKIYQFIDKYKEIFAYYEKIILTFFEVKKINKNEIN